jgi:predicted glutamine amidotransferase
MTENDITDAGYFNMVVTNGSFVVGTRYVTDSTEPLTLYHSGKRKYICEDGVCHMVDDDDNGSVMVVSEKLTDADTDWTEVPWNHFVVVNDQLDVSTHPIRV